jgi:integrase/recombinase XerD
MSSTEVTRVKVEPGIWLRGKTYEITFRDSSGAQRRRKVDGGITAARKALEVAKAARTKGEQSSADPRLTFGKAADAWFEGYVVPNLRPASRDCYSAALKHLRKAFGSKRLTDITPADVARYVKSKPNLKGNTLKSHMTALSAVYKFAHRWLGYRGECPSAALESRERPNSDDARERRALTSNELAALIENAAKTDRLMYRFASETGLRMSEVLGLLWSDLDLGDSPAVNVSQQLSRYDRERVALKNSRRCPSRRVVITDDLKSALVAWRLASKLSQDGHPVFPTTLGTHRHQSNVGAAFAATVKRAGLDPNITFHLLRHTHGSHLAANGWSVTDIADRLGDSIETVQSVYLHAYDATKREAENRERLAALMAAQNGSMTQQSLPATGTDPRS